MFFTSIFLRLSSFTLRLPLLLLSSCFRTFRLRISPPGLLFLIQVNIILDFGGGASSLFDVLFLFVFVFDEFFLFFEDLETLFVCCGAFGVVDLEFCFVELKVRQQAQMTIIMKGDAL